MQNLKGWKILTRKIDAKMYKVPYIRNSEIRRIIDDQIALACSYTYYQLPLDIEDFVEVKLGIPLCIVPLNKNILGYADMENQAICINSMIEDQPQRFRFTIAHELGHITLHRNLVKQNGFNLNAFNHLEPQTENEKRIEYQANTYAGEILIPSRYLDDLYSKGGEKWGVDGSYKDNKIANQPPLAIIRTIAKDCEVSHACAKVRLQDYMKSKFKRQAQKQTHWQSHCSSNTVNLEGTIDFRPALDF